MVEYQYLTRGVKFMDAFDLLRSAVGAFMILWLFIVAVVGVSSFYWGLWGLLRG
jgi:hypothetical protein